jgi:dTDP-4-dehydrorhamnose reductase
MLITGGSGYLGHWVAQLARERWEVTACYGSNPGALEAVGWRRLDVRDARAVTSLVTEVDPDVIVHTAARNPGQGNDFETVNVTGTANVAAAAGAIGARLVHISTDMVFDGQQGNYGEDDAVHPLTDYGRSKAAAERAVADSGAAAAIVRTSLIYGWRPTLARAARWMIDALERGETVRLWSDEMRCPIWVESLAAAIVELAAGDYTGVLHVAGSEKMSRYDFGSALLRFLEIESRDVVAEPVPPGELRPRDCSLDISRARLLLDTPLPGVTEVLTQ